MEIANKYIISGVSPDSPKPQRRGGSRNHADRESHGLTAAQILNLEEAAWFAGAIGLPLNRMITIHWESAGVPLNAMAKATGDFLDRMSKTLARHGRRTAGLWVHENGDWEGGHCHLLFHVPADLVPIVTASQRSWLRKITGRAYRKNVIHSRPIGRHLGLETTNPDLHAVNLNALLRYVFKGATAEAAYRLGLTRLKPGGRIIGKRCGTSQNIAVSARRKHVAREQQDCARSLVDPSHSQEEPELKPDH